MTPEFSPPTALKPATEPNGFESLERKMVRTLALHREMKKILEAEYAAGSNYDGKALSILTLRKTNCINRFEYLVGSIRDQMKEMAPAKLPPTCPRTLANRLKAIPGLTPELAERMLPLARELESENRLLIQASRRNVRMLKEVMDRIRAVYQYTRRQGHMG